MEIEAITMRRRVHHDQGSTTTSSGIQRKLQFQFHARSTVGILVSLVWFATAGMYLHARQLDNVDTVLYEASQANPSGNQTVSSSSVEDGLKFVVFSTTLDTVARQEDYAYLAPLVAQSWSIQGFHPIILVVAENFTTYRQVMNDWKILLPSDAMVVAIPKVPSSLAVTVAQIARLFTAYLVPSLADDTFLRITDGDMMISNGTVFAPPKDDTAITIFNGQCCLGEYKLKLNKNHAEETCTQYPMHSVGMKVGLWRSLFAISPTPESDIQQSIIEMATELIQSMATQEQEKHGVQHGGLGWSIDQILLGCAVTKAVKREGKKLSLPIGQRRLHVWDPPPNPGQALPTDIHLASFRLAKHHYWMKKLVNQTSVLHGVEPKYNKYSHQWMQRYNVTPRPFVLSDNKISIPSMQIKVRGINFN